MTEFKPSTFSVKIKRLVLIVECLFVCRSMSSRSSAPLLKRGPEAPAHLHLKGQTQKQSVLAHTLKVVILTSYKIICGVFEHKLHIQDLGTSETYFTSCYKGIIGLCLFLLELYIIII